MTLANIELKLLQYLVALVEESSVTRAAERLDISQPRMSNALRRLRDICDDPLLVRAGRRLVPTGRAVEIADQVRSGLEEINAALASGRPFDPATCRRNFVVMMSDYTAAVLLPEAVHRIEDVAPGIEISMLPISHTSMQQSFDEGLCDIAFGYFKALHPNLRVSNCFQDDPVCIASAAFPLEGDELTLEQFVAARHVCMGDAANSTSTIDVICDQELHALGHRRKISVRSPTPSAVARIVARTRMLGLLPQRLASDYARQLPLRQLAIPLSLPPFDVSMVWHERSQKDAGHAWLRDQFRHIAGTMRAIG